jgi:hypothetical protein
MKSSFLSSDGVSINPRAVDSAAQFARDYLSREHFEDIDGTCPLIAFPTDFLHEETLESEHCGAAAGGWPNPLCGRSSSPFGLPFE